MTSANVTHYEIYDHDMNLLATESQHALCKDRISAVLEKWENEYIPSVYLAMRWPDEHEVDQYLTFDEQDGYDEDLGTNDVYYENDRDLIALHVFMKRKRIKEIEVNERMLENCRERLKEYTGNQLTSDFNQRKEFHKFTHEKEAEAGELGDNVRARCWVDEETGKFRCEFLLTCLRAEDVRMAQEAISHFYGTGRVPQYDEAYPEG